MLAYYGTKISPHMTDTPEGYLICHDVAIARTGDMVYRASELQRRLEDAFLPDSRILGIKDFRWTFSGVSLTASFTVPTVFGDVPAGMEVPLA
jgi:hypothetical protein